MQISIRLAPHCLDCLLSARKYVCYQIDTRENATIENKNVHLDGAFPTERRKGYSHIISHAILI